MRRVDTVHIVLSVCVCVCVVWLMALLVNKVRCWAGRGLVLVWHVLQHACSMHGHALPCPATLGYVQHLAG